MNSTTLNKNQIDPDHPMAHPIDDQDLDGYRYQTFRAALVLNDARFSPNALKPGQGLSISVESAPGLGRGRHADGRNGCRSSGNRRAILRNEIVKQQTATVTLTDKNFNQHGLENSRPFVVHFSTDWSGSSDIMTCIIDDLALEYADEVTFGKIDADKHNQIAAIFGIESVPTLLFFNNGRVVDQITGMVSKGELADKLKTLAP